MNIFNPSRSRLINEFETLQQIYRQANPCPHLVIDRLFDPQILVEILREFPLTGDRQKKKWELISQGKVFSRAVARLSDYTRTFYFWLNSTDFIRAMALAVNQKRDSLVGDPTFYGGGLHEIVSGGELASTQNRLVHSCLPLIGQFNLIICLSPLANSDSQGKIEIVATRQVEKKITYSLKFNRTLILPLSAQAKYRIINHSCDNSSAKFLSIYYWSLSNTSF